MCYNLYYESIMFPLASLLLRLLFIILFWSLPLSLESSEGVARLNSWHP